MDGICDELVEAAKAGTSQPIEKFLKDLQSIIEKTALQAVLNGHNGIATLLLQNRKDKDILMTNIKILLNNIRDYKGQTGLHYAASQNDSEKLEILVKYGANCDAIGQNGYTPLHYACHHRGQTRCVEILVDAHARVDMFDDNGNTALHLASFYGNLKSVKLLIQERNADVRIKNIKTDRMPLHYAAEKGRLPVVKYLLTRKQDVNARDENGNTALHLAASEGFIQTVQTLIGKGHANINASNNDIRTPLHLAVEEGHEDTVKFLIGTRKCLINAKDKLDNTALHLATQQENLEIMRLLIQEGKANVNAKNYWNDNILHIICKSGNVDILEFIVNHDIIDINARNNLGNTALHVLLSLHDPCATVVDKDDDDDDEPTGPLSDVYEIYEQLFLIHRRIRLQLAMACYLVQSGINVDARNNQNELALDYLHDSPHLKALVKGYLVKCLVCDNVSKKMKMALLHPCQHDKCVCKNCASLIDRCPRCTKLIAERIDKKSGNVIPFKSDPSSRGGSSFDDPATLTCPICMDLKRDVSFLCGHGACAACAYSLEKCHICREKITNRIPFYL